MNIPESNLLFPTSESVSIYVIEKIIWKKNCQYQIHKWLCARVNRNNTIFFLALEVNQPIVVLWKILFLYTKATLNDEGQILLDLQFCAKKLLVLYCWTVNWNETKKKQNKKKNEWIMHAFLPAQLIFQEKKESNKWKKWIRIQSNKYCNLIYI